MLGSAIPRKPIRGEREDGAGDVEVVQTLASEHS